MLGWGMNTHGQLGLGPSAVSSFIPTPQRIPFFNENLCLQVSCSLTHSAFLLQDGSIYTAGSNEYSQLGREGRPSVPEKVLLPQNSDAVQVACGQHFTICLTSHGKIVVWGSISGKINSDDGFYYNKPEYLGGFSDKRMIQIAAGYNHCLGLTDDGTVYSTGINSHGQLGLGHNRDCVRATPIACLRGSPITFIACGAYHTLIISRSGTVFTCGCNSSGQLGLGDTDSRVWPSNIKLLQQQKAAYASCGEKHSVVVTLDGGVFSFGSSSHGQLGHNSTNDEILPRKISELMGSEVSQVACGRSHTIIFLPNVGQIETFGLACTGRIDSKLTTYITQPQKLAIPLLPYKTMKELNKTSTDRNHTTASRKYKTADTKNVSTNFQVVGIYAGGHQIFIRISSRPQRPDDYRTLYASRPLLELNLDFARWLSHVPQTSDTLKDIDRKLSRLLSTESCLNGSFLSLSDAHFRTSSSNPGVDLDQVIVVMEKLRSCDPRVQQMLLEHIQSILLTLPETAPCFEALRIYVVLPFCHIFENEESFESITAPFAQAAIRLKKTADGRVLDYWILHVGKRFVQRIIELYKPLIIKIIQINSMGSALAAEQYQTVLEAVLELLKKVHNVSCNMAKPELVKYDAFYMKELNDMIDIKRDYDFWQTRRYLSMDRKIVSFCDYPFLFDLKAKILLLQYHGQLEMQEAIRSAFLHNFQTMMGSRVETVNPLLMLHVRRDTIVQDTIAQLDKYKDDDFKKPLQVYFHNEEGLDAGGIRKEFFLLLTKEILNPKYGMFIVYEETNAIWFSDFYDEEEESLYKLIGTLCALAVYNITIIDLPFPLALYKKLLNKTKIDLDDVKSLSPTVYNSLKSLLLYKDDDLETALCYAFDIEREIFGERRRIELKPGGSSIMVNQKNKQEFVELYIDYIFNKSCEKQFQAFSTGFRRVINSKPLELFYPDELMSFVIGNTNYDWNEFQKKTEYKGEYHGNHPVIQWFWQVFHKLPEGDKKKFLLFLTGSDRVPVFGWSQTLPMTIQRSHTDDKHLPVSHTCFNILDLPSYSSKDILKSKLLEAIQHNQGFNLV